MAYTHFDQAKPDGTGNGSVTLQHMRENMVAMRDIVTLGASPGWNYSWSGGTADRPTTMLWSKAGSTERLRSVNTWGVTGGAADNVTQSALSYSADSGTIWVLMGTQTIAYDASGNVTSTTWS